MSHVWLFIRFFFFVPKPEFWCRLNPSEIYHSLSSLPWCLIRTWIRSCLFRSSINEVWIFVSVYFSGGLNRHLLSNKIHSYQMPTLQARNAGEKDDISFSLSLSRASSLMSVSLLRTSVCRMSSRDKMSVQDQSKERGVSGGLEINDVRESSPGLSLSLKDIQEHYHIYIQYMKHTCIKVQSVWRCLFCSLF